MLSCPESFLAWKISTCLILTWLILEHGGKFYLTLILTTKIFFFSNYKYLSQACMCVVLWYWLPKKKKKRGRSILLVFKNNKYLNQLCNVDCQRPIFYLFLVRQCAIEEFWVSFIYAIVCDIME